MKIILSLFILIGSFTTCIAQSWKPYVFNAKCIYGYKQMDGTTELISIRYDSVYMQGAEETAFAYTRSYLNDTCLDAAYRNIRFDRISENYDYSERPIPIEIRCTPDSIISSQYILPTNAQIDQHWGDYTCESHSVMPVLGLMDSVKVFSSKYSDRIVLSKHYGLVQINDYMLMGFQTDSLNTGLSIPPIEKSMALAAGDILYYRTEKDTSTYPTNGDYLLYADTRDSITAVEIAQDTLSIHFTRHEQNFFYPAQSFNNKPITVKYYLPELNNLFQDGSPSQRDGYFFCTKRRVLMNIEATDTVFSLRLFLMGQFGACGFYSMYDVCSSWSFSSKTIELAYSSCNAIYGGGSQTNLIGSRIGNKVSGHINLGIENAQSNLKELTIFPNPTSDLLNLNTNEELNFTIIDMLGNKQMEGKTHQIISVQSLPDGLYMLILNSQTASKTARILKK